MQRKRHAILITLLGSLVYLLFFLTSNRLWLRVDLTRHKSYTISAGTRRIVEDLKAPLSITYYVSDSLVRLHPMPGEIADLLAEYASYSGRTIRVSTMDPSKSLDASAIEALGLVPKQIQVTERDQVRVASVYSGIVVQYLERTETIPFVFSLDSLEYDLTSRISAISSKQPKAVAVLVAQEGKTWDADYRHAQQALSASGYAAIPLHPGEPLSQDISTLIVFGGATLDSSALIPIENFIASGHSVFFAVDGVAVSTQGELSAKPVGDAALFSLLGSYGVTVMADLLLDTSSPGLPVPSTSASGETRVTKVQYPLWITIQEGGVSQESPITARFPGLDLYWASPLSIKAIAGLNVQVLLSTTAQSWLMKEPFSIDPSSAPSFYNQVETTRRQRPVAVTVSGPHSSRLVVVGDSEFASDLIDLTGSVGNLEFFLACVEWLSADEDLLAIRGKAPQTATLDGIAEPDKKARVMDRAVILNLIVLPALVILFGLIRLRRRLRPRG